jgi:hypothetical protein
MQNVAFTQSLMRYCDLRATVLPSLLQPVRSYIFTFHGQKHIALLNDDPKNLCNATFEYPESDLHVWQDILTGQTYQTSNGQMQVNIPPHELRVFRESGPDTQLKR